MNWGLAPFLAVGAGLAIFGFLAVMIRRDVGGWLLGLVFILAAGCLDLLAAGRFLADLAGSGAALVVIALGVAQIVVLSALARGATAGDDAGGQPGR